MKTVYILTHIHQDTVVVGTFTDLKKAVAAMDLYCDYIKAQGGMLQTEQELDVERRYERQRNLRNGHIVKVVESRLFTDIGQFKKIIIG